MRSWMRGVTARSFSGVGWKPGLPKKGWSCAAKFGGGQGADVFGIEPDGLRVEGIFFGEVDDGVGAVDAFEGEEGGEFFEREELAVVFGRPAEEAEEIDEGVREKSGVAIGGDGDDGAVVALGELGAVGGDEQRQVGELRRRRRRGPEDQDVLEGVGEMGTIGRPRTDGRRWPWRSRPAAVRRSATRPRGTGRRRPRRRGRPAARRRRRTAVRRPGSRTTARPRGVLGQRRRPSARPVVRGGAGGATVVHVDCHLFRL